MEYIAGKIVIVALIGMAFWVWEKAKINQRLEVARLNKAVEDGTMGDLSEAQFILFYKSAIKRLPADYPHWPAIHDERSVRDLLAKGVK